MLVLYSFQIPPFLRLAGQVVNSCSEIYYQQLSQKAVDNKFIVNITLAPFSRNTTGSKPDISSENNFLANPDE